MKQREKEKAATPETETPLVPKVMAYIGPAVVAAGMWFMQKGNTVRPTGTEWMWYAGLVMAVCGAVVWLTAGMGKTQLFEWSRSALLALGLALVIRWAVAEPYRIPSGSMETTLHGDPGFGKGDRVFVNKWVYGIRVPFMNKRLYEGHPPRRWDIVVFKTVEKDAIHKTLVKRIVGMPGERIQIKGGRVYADGVPLEPPPSMPEKMYYTSPLDGIYGVQPADEFSVVPEGHYLVLGDNSAQSRDGRYFGWLPRNNIVGRVAAIWWPPPRWRDFTGFSETFWWRLTVALVFGLTGLRLFVGRLCSIQRAGQAGPRRCVALFAAYGLRIPFTRRWFVRWARPRRGDLALVSFDAPDGQELLVIGRVAGLPGERVAFGDGKLLVNDRDGDLPDCLTGVDFGKAAPEALFGKSRGREYSVVPPGHYFVLCEPSNGEEIVADSRALGWVPAARVMGRVMGGG